MSASEWGSEGADERARRVEAARAGDTQAALEAASMLFEGRGGPVGVAEARAELERLPVG